MAIGSTPSYQVHVLHQRFGDHGFERLDGRGVSANVFLLLERVFVDEVFAVCVPGSENGFDGYAILAVVLARHRVLLFARGFVGDLPVGTKMRAKVTCDTTFIVQTTLEIEDTLT